MSPDSKLPRVFTWNLIALVVAWIALLLILMLPNRPQPLNVLIGLCYAAALLESIVLFLLGPIPEITRRLEAQSKLWTGITGMLTMFIIMAMSQWAYEGQALAMTIAFGLGVLLVAATSKRAAKSPLKAM